LVPEEKRGEAFDELIDLYEKKIFNLIYRLIGNRDDAADLTQETFVAAFRSYSSFKRESSAYTWLCSIAVNKCKNRFRDLDRRRQYEGPSLDASLLGETGAAAAPVTEGPEELLERTELKRRVEQAIGRLPHDYRIVEVLRDLHGLSYQEIAEVTELSVEVVKTRLARARAMIRRSLEAYLSHE